ncbi:MAG: hypothetical protein JJT94_14700 [Bernardetiaceae bacterium]|nr:hypothetical protein [Bernardetiaceae bacterium]
MATKLKLLKLSLFLVLMLAFSLFKSESELLMAQDDGLKQAFEKYVEKIKKEEEAKKKQAEEKAKKQQEDEEKQEQPQETTEVTQKEPNPPKAQEKPKLTEEERLQALADSLAKLEEQKPVNLIDTLAFQRRIQNARQYKEYGTKDDDFWDRLRGISEKNAYKVQHERNPDIKIFGWHPYWMGTAYKSYNFSLLSHITYFSYELNPATGDYNTIHNWRTTSLVDSAKANGTKVLLSVTNFGSANNMRFLRNKAAQKKCIDNLKMLLAERDAHGVDIDFENVSAVNRNDFTNFLIDLSLSLRAQNPEYIISLCLPAIDFNKVYDITQLEEHIDIFVIMGYEFYGMNSEVAGPVSPVNSGSTWWPYNLTSSVSDYLASGVPATKLLMGLPYYGSEWQTEGLKIPSKVERFINYRMYRNIRDAFGVINCCQDEVSMSRFYAYRDSDNNYRQVWFEDERSLAQKYDWVLEQKIGGIGIWALGYDNGYDDLWKVMGAKFAPADTLAGLANKTVIGKRFQNLRITPSSFMRIIRNPQSFFKGKSRYAMTFLFTSVLGLHIGVLIFIRRYGCKMPPMSLVALRALAIFAAVAFIGLLLYYFEVATSREVIIGLVIFAIATILFLLLGKRFFQANDLP